MFFFKHTKQMLHLLCLDSIKLGIAYIALYINILNVWKWIL